MLQILLGTVYWQREQGSCIFCKSNKRVGVNCNQTHVCTPITNDEHLSYYIKAQRMYKGIVKANTANEGKVDDRKALKLLHEWAGENNYGITGLGLHPSIFPISMVRPDVFHLSMGVTKKLLKYTQFILNKVDGDVRDRFEKLLAKFLTDEEILIWKLDKPIDSYKGKELQNFTDNFPKLAKGVRLEKLIEQSPAWDALMNAIELWPKIYNFIVKAKVEEGEDYEALVKQFEEDVKQFYEYGKVCFLRGNTGIDGAGETTYLHILRYNLATFARQLYKDHKLGIGVFSMQGFERRNKESKHIYTHHTNNKGNSSISTLKGLNRMFQKLKQD